MVMPLHKAFRLVSPSVRTAARKRSSNRSLGRKYLRFDTLVQASRFRRQREWQLLQITLPGTQLAVSRFAFGIGSLFSGRPPAAAQRIIDAAADHGFTHFDTAPLYGFGLGESGMAPFLRAHRHATVTTKTGLYPPGGPQQGSLQVQLRKIAGKLLPSLSRPVVDFSVARARQSLDQSLKRLGRDKVDIFLVHEPDIGLIDADEWLRWLEQEKHSGRVGHFGIAGLPHRIRPFLEIGSPMADIIQIPDSLDNLEADALKDFGRPMQFTHSYLNHASNKAADRPVQAILAGALRRNSTGAIIVSTRKIDRLPQYGQALDAAQAA
jgi:D-threo-aldose 1-dehydrogenase